MTIDNQTESSPRKSDFHVGSTMTINVLGCAPRETLRNIHGFNWPSPPLSIDHVTYSYIDDAQSAQIQQYADACEAGFRHQEVRVDRNRVARLIYHGDGAHVHLKGPVVCLLVVEDVLEGNYAGTRWLHLVHSPGMAGIPKKPKIKNEEDANVQELANDLKDVKLSPGVAPSFSQASQ
ncbi:hypothetical protein DFJ77DRAFT_115695 [Powellomyces hirtus]|nr:hypothetical protein DFJ77DRAFT_115695 [Powellomyces hirtus]